MKPYILKNEEDEPFAEGIILSDGRCFISFIRADYTFVYQNEDELMGMHSNDGKNTIHFLNVQKD